MNLLEKSAIVLAVALVGLFAMEGVTHSATWLVAVSAMVVSATLGMWVVTASRWRRRSESARR